MAMRKFSDYMDRSRQEALLGEMLGTFAELEAQGHSVLHIADAAILAAIRKVHRTQPVAAAHAWSLRLRDLMAFSVEAIDEATEKAAQSRARLNLN